MILRNLGRKTYLRVDIEMTLLIILACVFGAVALMVVLGERFGKPMSEEQQAKFSKVSWILVAAILLAAIVREITQ
mgnify:CR=1 FL=1|jgi:hypothetical protein